MPAPLARPAPSVPEARSPRPAPLGLRWPAALVVLSVLSAGGLAMGCGGAGAAEPRAASSLGLPKWQGMDKDLFGDEIDPAAVGLIPPKNPRKDQVLWARAQAAEVVGRVRVQTFTVDTRAGEVTYHLTLRFADPLLGDSQLAEREFEVGVEARDPSFGLVKALDTGIKGKTFVGFVKRFAGVDDEIEAHFYLASDSAEVAAAVQEAIAVKEVQKR